MSAPKESCLYHALTGLPENVPANCGKTFLQPAGMFSGGGMTRRAWEVAADAKRG